MTDCIFCKMVEGLIKPDVVYENDNILAFKDLHPQAPTHLLIIPKQHVATLDELQDQALAGELFLTPAKIAKQLNLENGYRTVINCKKDGGQEVYHLHLHLLAGRRLHWPPG